MLSSTARRKPPNKSISFSNVEVIELPIIPGEHHPDNTNQKRKGDTASITVDWEAQKRTTIQLDTFEKQKAIEANCETKQRDRGKVRRLSRAFRRHLLKSQKRNDCTERNSPSSSSDFLSSSSSEDESGSRKSRRKKHKAVRLFGSKKRDPTRTILPPSPLPSQQEDLEQMRYHLDDNFDHVPIYPVHTLSPQPTLDNLQHTKFQMCKKDHSNDQIESRKTNNHDATPTYFVHKLSPYPPTTTSNSHQQPIFRLPSIQCDISTSNLHASEFEAETNLCSTPTKSRFDADGIGMRRVDVTPKKRIRRNSIEYVKNAFRRGSIENLSNRPLWKSDSFITMTPTEKFKTSRSANDHTPQKICRRGSMEHTITQLLKTRRSGPASLVDKNVKEQSEGCDTRYIDKKCAINPSTMRQQPRRSSMEHVKNLFKRRKSIGQANTEQRSPSNTQTPKETKPTLPPSTPDLSNSSHDMVRPTPSNSAGSRTIRRSSMDYVTNYVRSTFRRGSIEHTTSQIPSCTQNDIDDDDNVSLDPMDFYEADDHDCLIEEAQEEESQVCSREFKRTQRRTSMEHVTHFVRSTFRRGSIDCQNNEKHYPTADGIDESSQPYNNKKRHRVGRRSSLEHVKSTIANITKQPLVFAAIPIRLARTKIARRYTKKQRCASEQNHDAESVSVASNSIADQSCQSQSHHSSSIVAGSIIESLRFDNDEGQQMTTESKDHQINHDFNRSQSSALGSFMQEVLLTTDDDEKAKQPHTVFIVPDDLHNSFGSIDFDLHGDDDDGDSLPSLVHEELTSSHKDHLKANMERYCGSSVSILIQNEPEYASTFKSGISCAPRIFEGDDESSVDVGVYREAVLVDCDTDDGCYKLESRSSFHTCNKSSSPHKEPGIKSSEPIPWGGTGAMVAQVSSGPRAA